MVTTLVMYILSKHTKCKSLVTSLALQQIKEVGVVTKQESVTFVPNTECTCNIQWYTILMLGLSGAFYYSKIKKNYNCSEVTCSPMQ